MDLFKAAELLFFTIVFSKISGSLDGIGFSRILLSPSHLRLVFSTLSLYFRKMLLVHFAVNVERGHIIYRPPIQTDAKDVFAV